MTNYSVSLAPHVSRINPVLDFSENTAFVAVKIPLQTRSREIIQDQVLIVTSNREIIIWDETSQFGADIIFTANCPTLLEPRWSGQSLHAFQSGMEAPASAEIYDRIRSYLRKYLGFRNPTEYDLVTLWIMGTYLKPLFKCYPILYFNAPYESGKSRCLEVISQLSFNGKWFGEITPASFRRYGDEIRPTFCLDELKDVGLKNDSAMISILLNSYNSSEVVVSNPNRRKGWVPTLFKVASPIAIGNVKEMKNEALKSRAIQIKPEYNPDYKNITLPGVYDPEPSQIRDVIYCWFLRHWQSVKENYRAYPGIPDLSAREMDSYKPFLAIAGLIGPEAAEAVIRYAVTVKENKSVARKATDDRLDLLIFLKSELETRVTDEARPTISNKELADAYGRKNNQRQNYRRFMELVTGLNVVTDIKNYSGSKYLVLNSAEIERQIRLAEVKS